MALGTLTGLAVAKTKIQLETRRRDARNREARRHTEVEMAVSSGIGEQEAPLEPLEGVLGVEDIAETNYRRRELDRAKDEIKVKQGASGSRSLLGMGWNATWFTLQTSKGIAVGLYEGGDYVRSILYPPKDKQKKKK
ncbi:uncharacterized protein PITG_12587 [Phytophthora infestans T30-4]|uniref:Uncharacterized protein n=2 Tax=Phytophthora infestans TaxID=4787 RepID=D0NKW2_PHYIT|nr:uncharacterized protein PITG_12587 [Phytophthora infestans T30-4]EEY60248.1 conserved hypothetical protein [Phytophthora infestans T30-4]|eukprot:XP_002900455.1 conserved hypothetical protein [Phytophthora infestans T30-4]